MRPYLGAAGRNFRSRRQKSVPLHFRNLEAAGRNPCLSPVEGVVLLIKRKRVEVRALHMSRPVVAHAGR